LGGCGRYFKSTQDSEEGIMYNEWNSKQESCRPIFKESGIFTVTSLYILEVISYIKRHKADLIQNINIHNHNMRLNKDYHINYCRASLFKRSVINRGIELYSKVRNKIKNMESFPIFKRELKSFLLSHAFFFTIDEFIGFNTKLDV
jgi:hypothetical protein